MPKIKVSDYIAKRLKNHHKVNHFFMISGGGAMHLNDSLGRNIPYTTNHNEQASAIAAEGYARYNQDLAVVNITTGPGGLNCLNGVFGQWTDSAPVLYISGQVKFETTISSCKDIPLRQLGDQEVDIISVVKPLTKYAVMVTDPNTIKYHLDKAIFLAQNGRKGPVWLDIPINIQAAIIDEKKLKNYNPKEDKINFPNYTKKIKTIISKLKTAKRPLIVAGHGIRLSKSENLFKQFLKKVNIPVVTTFNGIDLLDDNSKNFTGRIGTVGQRSGNFTLQNADVVLFLGTRNNIRQISYNWENFAKKAYKIVVDIDKAELCKPTLKANLSVNADLSDFLKDLLKNAPVIKKEDWLEWSQNLKKRYSFKDTPQYQQKGNKINPYYFIRTLTENISKNSTVIAANGSACVCLFQAGRIKEGQRVFFNSGDASMGYDLPASIGACISSDNEETICIAGDGSIMMNLQELQTIKQYNLPIKIFILNNDGYVSIRQTQNNFFKGCLVGACPKSGVTIPDFVKVGKAFGIKSFAIKSPKNLEVEIKKALALKGPVVIDVKLERNYIFSPKLSARKLSDGTMVSPSLEDMFPFLDRKEFEDNFFKN